ncbi:MAG: 4Fe-4S dicluster domain-containing protein [Pseudomonadota bacterium]
MNGYFHDLYSGSKSLLSGMLVTFKAFVQPIVTVQYPREKIDVTPNIRGRLELVKDSETGSHRCIVCNRCANECPSSCIDLEGEKQEGVKGKVLIQYVYDFTRCSLCGNCVDVCPASAIGFSCEYELASLCKEDFMFDLLKEVKQSQ